MVLFGSSGAMKSSPVHLGIWKGWCCQTVSLSFCVLALQRLPCRIRQHGGSKRITSVATASHPLQSVPPVPCGQWLRVDTCVCNCNMCSHIKMSMQVNAYLYVLINLFCVCMCARREQVAVLVQGMSTPINKHHLNLGIQVPTQASVTSFTKWERHTDRCCYPALFTLP